MSPTNDLSLTLHRILHQKKAQKHGFDELSVWVGSGEPKEFCGLGFDQQKILRFESLKAWLSVVGVIPNRDEFDLVQSVWNNEPGKRQEVIAGLEYKAVARVQHANGLAVATLCQFVLCQRMRNPLHSPASQKKIAVHVASRAWGAHSA